MTILRVVSGLLVMEGIGAAVLTMLLTDLSRWGLAAKLGLSFGLGLVVLTLSLFLASLCGLIPSWYFGISEMLVLFVAVVIFRREQLSTWSKPSFVQPSPAPVGWLRCLEIGLLLLLLGICVTVGAVSLLEPLVEWDVLAGWSWKAKILLHEPVATSGFFTDMTRAYSHLDYPLLWPLTISWVWAWAGHADLEVVKALAPAMLVAFVATFYGLLRRHHDRTHALLFTALLTGLPYFLSQTSRLVTDIPLAYFVTVTFVSWYLWMKSRQCDDLKLAGVFAAGMLFTKNEGMGWFAVLLLIGGVAIVAGRTLRQCWPDVFWLLIVPAALTSAWFVFRLHIPKSYEFENYGVRINPIIFLQNLSRVPQILKIAPGYVFDFEDWLAFWPLVAAILILTFRHWLRRPLMFLLVVIVLTLLMYGYVCVVSPWKLEELFETAAQRLLLHVAPLCVFLMAELTWASRLLPWHSPTSEQ